MSENKGYNLQLGFEKPDAIDATQIIFNNKGDDGMSIWMGKINEEGTVESKIFTLDNEQVNQLIKLLNFNK